MKLASIFDARVIDASEDTVTLEAMAERNKFDDLLRLLQPFGIREIARAGTLAIGRVSTSTPGRAESMTQMVG